MTLRRHVCRLPHRAKGFGDNIWISEDALDNAIQHFSGFRISRRRLGLAPGPLEARKRATKRRMMDLAQIGGGGEMLDPSLLPWQGKPIEPAWQWQNPSQPRSRNQEGMRT